MNNSMRCALIGFAVLISVAVGEWEVINGENESESDDFLKEEDLIPVDPVPKHNSKGAQRKLNFFDQDVKTGKHTELAPPAYSHDAKNTDLNLGAKTYHDDVIQMTSHDAPANQFGASKKSEPDSPKVEVQSEDEIVLKEEGYILVETKKRLPPSGRKLAQFIGPLPENVYKPVQQGVTATRKNIPDVKIVSQNGLIGSQKIKSNAKGNVGYPTDDDVVQPLEYFEKAPVVAKNLKTDDVASMKDEFNAGDDVLQPLEYFEKASVDAKSLKTDDVASRGDGLNAEEDVFQPLEYFERAPLERAGEPFIGPIDEREAKESWDKGVQMLDESNFEIDCADKNSWECMMFKEDFLAMKHDRNLSGLSEENKEKKRAAEKAETTGKSRQKRQLPATTRAPPTTTDCGTADNPDCGSGARNLLYPSEETITPLFNFDSTSRFDAGGLTQEDLTETRRNQLKLELKEKLSGVFRRVTGFQDVTVKNVTIVNGELVFDWTMSINPADPLFLGGTKDTIVDQVTDDLSNVNGSYKNSVSIGGRPVLGPLELGREDVESAVDVAYTDPCSTNPCTDDYANCTIVDTGNETISLPTVRCAHKCFTFEEQRECEHGGTCELDRNNEPFCSCTRNWEGAYCQRGKEQELDGGQITGIVLGTAMCCAGIIGCCFWFLCCCRRQSDMLYTHYSDEEGSGMYGSPSSKLSQFVIDRPHVSVQPIPCFSPSLPGSENSGSSNSSSRARSSSVSSRRSSFPSFRV